MHIDHLRERFPDESACRQFLESVIWTDGRICPRCKFNKSYEIKGESTRSGLYECAWCKKQFTVTTRTPFHGTKLTLWKWIKAIYFIVSSSKGISSVILGRLIGVSQKTAWKIGHAIREMMDSDNTDIPMLKGIVEVDEKFIGGKPRYADGFSHKRGKGTTKSQILVTTERLGSVYSNLIESDKVTELKPLLDRLVDKSAHLMTDKSMSHMSIGKQFADHSAVNHSAKEYARGDVHSNTAESFSSILERTRIGVFHYMSDLHLHRYLNEASFRWSHRVPERITIKKGKRKIKWSPPSFMPTITTMVSNAFGRQLRRSRIGGILRPKQTTNFTCGLCPT